jgi:hypothetical protein
MTERSREWVLERVRKLLALGTNQGATEGERDNAMRMAHTLLAKYNMDMAEIKLDTGEDVEERKIFKSNFYGRPWARQVAQYTAKLFFCEYIYTSATRATETTHYFVGRESNCITACEMSAYLIVSIQREGRRRNPGMGNPWLRSFCSGAAERVVIRVADILRKSEKQSRSRGNGTALVLASLYHTEQTANKALMDESFKEENRRDGRTGKNTGISSAYNEGHEYGGTLGLERQLTGGKSQERLEKKP